MKNIRKYMVLFLALCLATGLQAQVRLPRLISDSMVLQRNIPLNIWGWAAPGEKVSVEFNGKKYSTLTANDGKWAVKLDKIREGGPFTMQIDASNHITIRDILIGDVWVCSGQSNMEYWMGRVKEKYAKEIASSANTYIRQFLVNRKYSFTRQFDDVTSKGWKAANPGNVLDFTAVGYFFARELYNKYKIPIGLLHSSWGGTPAEAWMSEDALKAFPNYTAVVADLKDSARVQQIIKDENQAKTNWNRQVKADDQGFASPAQPWYYPVTDVSSWLPFQVPGFWEDQGLKNLDGVVWFRKDIEITSDMTGKEAILQLGNLVDEDTAYVNGVRVGTTSNKYFPRAYKIPATLLKEGKNTIVVRLLNRSANGGFIPDKPYRLDVGSKVVDLTGTWMMKVGAVATASFPAGTTFSYKPLGLYNAMVAPLVPYAIKGVIWYQGEANSGKAFEYQKLFPALITNWRQKWGIGDFPFLYVQLAAYMPAKTEPGESSWNELREAQLKTLSLPNTGMAVAIDIGEWNDVHPTNKEDVGKRLALAAQKVAYKDKSVVYSGPVYKSMKISGNKIILSFTNTGSGLVAKGGSDLHYFAIAGDDHKYVWAKATIDGNKVIVWNDNIAHPVAVRYAWADNPVGANLYNKEGLPASTFRTDNWKGVTEK